MAVHFEKTIDSKLIYKHFAWFTEHTANRTVPGMPVCAVETAAEVEALPETLEQLIKENA